LADGYGGYDGVVAGNAITRAGCWSHSRRKFVDAEKVAPEIAREAVDLISALFRVERQAKDFSVEQRLALRRAKTAPILAQLREKLLGWKEQLLPKHPMAEAVNYALNQWDELNVFCSDGAVPIDNNVSEREMKRIILNRKNSLFVGNPRGGRTAAILASLTSTCRRHEVDPQLYLTQLLMNIPQAKMSELPDWLPDQWKIRHLARIATFTGPSTQPDCSATKGGGNGPTAWDWGLAVPSRRSSRPVYCWNRTGTENSPGRLSLANQSSPLPVAHLSSENLKCNS
jgi:transposase